MKYKINPNYSQGKFIKICEEFYLQLNGSIPELCKIAELPLVTYYSWFATDSNFRDTVRLFEQALKDHSRSVLHSIYLDDNNPLKYRLQAYSLLYPDQPATSDSESSDETFSLNIQYNGSSI